MTKESIEWLNTHVLVGNTDARGTAWHYRASAQGEEPNHYPGPIPVPDVQRRLFNFRAVPARVAAEFPATAQTMTHLDSRGRPMSWAVQDDRQAIVSDDQDVVLGWHSDNYVPHQYQEWLLDQVATILDDGLSISSAGLLKNRAVAWVEVSVPQTITTKEGVAFRPNLLACTSLDGSLATTYKRTVQLTVCDNTMSAALGEHGQSFKVRHSRNSHVKLEQARDALAMVHQTADRFAADVARLTNYRVSPRQFIEVLDVIAPLEAGLSGRALTKRRDKRAQITRLYESDPRAAAWTGTAFGVLQAVNTWRHHEQNGLAGADRATRAQARADRNAWRAVSGETEREDATVMKALVGVL